MAEGPSIIELVVRLAFSLGIISGLLVLGAKVARRGGGGLRLPGMAAKQENPIKVLDRQSLNRNASVALVQVGARMMVVGVTENGISLLSEHADLTVESAEVAADSVAPRHLVAVPDGDPVEISTEAERTTPPSPVLVADLATPSQGSTSRMSLVEALRELTVRKA